MIVATICSLLLGLGGPVGPDARARQLARIVASGGPAEARLAEGELLSMGIPAIRPTVQTTAILPNDQLVKLTATLSKFGQGAYEALYEAGSDDLDAGRPERRWRLAIAAVAGMGARSTDEAARIMAEGRAYRREYGFAYGVLMAQGELAVPALTTLASNQDGEVRASAVYLLGLTGAPDISEVLLRATGDGWPIAREQGLRFLGERGDPRVVPIARRAVLHDPSFTVRSMALLTLTRVPKGSLDLVLTVFAARSDADLLVRSDAGHLLKKSGSLMAARLAKRYEVADPSIEDSVERRRVMFVLVSALIIASLALKGSMRGHRRFADAGAMLPLACAAGLLAVGWMWGFWVTGIAWWTEFELLCIAIPVVVVAGALLSGRFGAAPGFSRRWLMLIVLVYVGYFIGWMQLWGWSFQWTELFMLWREAHTGA